MKRFLEVLEKCSELVNWIWSPETRPVLPDRSPRARPVLLRNRESVRNVEPKFSELAKIWDPASGPVLRVLSSHGRVLFRQNRGGVRMVEGALSRARPWMDRSWRR